MKEKEFTTELLTLVGGPLVDITSSKPTEYETSCIQKLAPGVDYFRVSLLDGPARRAMVRSAGRMTSEINLELKRRYPNIRRSDRYVSETGRFALYGLWGRIMLVGT